MDLRFRIDVQRLIAKYGLAAHLALLSVAPLFLFPFFTDGFVTRTLLWLSLLSALWMVFEPSMRAGESLSDSRRRVAKAILRDPLFWTLLVLVVFSGFQALNTGIALSYNAETSVWYVSDQAFPLLPGSVEGSGGLFFSAAAAFTVLLMAGRHSLGRSARQFFLLMSSALAGLAAVIDLLLLRLGGCGLMCVCLPPSDGFTCSFAGFVFGLYLIAALIALAVVFEQNWDRALAPAVLAIGGTVAGVVAFTPPYLSMVLVAVSLLTLIYVLVFSSRVFQPASLFKIVLFSFVALVLGGLFVVVVLPGDVWVERLSLLSEYKFLPDRFWKIREGLSAVAFKSWISHLWLGTGVSSFPLDFRIHAQASDWELLPRGVTMVANSWWLLLAERGVVGLMLFVLPFAFLLFTYVRRLIGGISRWELPAPVCIVAPLVLLLFVAAAFVDCSPLRVEVLLATGSLTVISTASFPRLRRGRNV